ncbi:hypothetical protein [Spirillospora sp. NBC_01491]|uniref:hypothetical protein n=1 Tax=Spirillospora sp. NBC_01491 TaxID=2976007 RepID=UPI002E36712A|nr:hypothetical protein [Spirillospora sp. NBC_01491]
MARELHKANGSPYPPLESLVRQIRGWERGDHRPDERTRGLYAAAFDTPEIDLFDIPRDIDDLSAAVLFGVVETRGERGRPVDADYVQTIRETNQHLISLDSLYGGNDLLPLSLRIFRAAHAKLATGHHERAIERDLEAATGETAEVTSWIAHDADKQHTARQVIHEALLLSRLAGDLSMELFNMSHLALLALHLRRSREALRLCEDMQDDQRMPPRVHALFDLRRARALAQMGDRPAAFAALDHATGAVTASITARDPKWTWWLDGAELAWHRGMLHVELGEWDPAITAITESASGRTNARRRASTRTRARYNDLAQLLEVLVHIEAWNEAEPVLIEVLDQAAEVGSARTTNILTGVVDGIVRRRGPSVIVDAAMDLRRLLDVVDPADDSAGLR